MNLIMVLNLVEGLDNLLDDVLPDDLKNLVLLKQLSGQVQRKVFGVHNTLDERQPFWDQVFSIISDEDSADVQLDVVLLLL